MEAFMTVVHEESRQKLMTPTIVKEGAVAAVTTPKNIQSTPVERMCDYCHKKKITFGTLVGTSMGGLVVAEVGLAVVAVAIVDRGVLSKHMPLTKQLMIKPVHPSPLWGIW
jgi:uncharacterized membrane protein